MSAGRFAVPDPVEITRVDRREPAVTRGDELRSLPVQTIDTTAELLQCSPAAVQRLVAAGQIPSFRLGRLVRIPTDGLIDWIGSLTRGEAS